MHKLLENYDRHISTKRVANPPEVIDDMVRRVNEKIIQLHGDELFPNDGQIMIGPVSLGMDGQVLTAKTRVFDTNHHLSAELSDEAVEKLAAALYSEISEEIKGNKGTNLNYYPYILVFGEVTSVCPRTAKTIEPTISFRTRYDMA